jgi:hypothetical protein
VPSDLPYRRALIIGALGPAVFALGLVWTVVRDVFADPAFTFRGIIFAPPHQMLFVGAVISIICLPVALAVRDASPDELALPGFDAKLHADPPGGRSPGGGERQRRRSYQGYN